jgi:flavodoxin
MKTAVVFYSYDGHCAFVAEELKARLNADLTRLYTTDEKRRRGFAKYAWGGSQVFMGIKPALKPCAFDAAAYDLIIIGAPVWAGSPAPPVRTFLAGAKISGKEVAFFVCHGGGKGKVMDKFRALLAGNTVAGEADFLNPGGDNGGESKRLIGEWAVRLGSR